MRDPDLLARLTALGLREVDEVRTHHNRTVMLSLRRRVLRVHAGYAAAPDDVLRAIVRFLGGRIPRSARDDRGRARDDRGRARDDRGRSRDDSRRVFLAFPVEDYAPLRPRRPRVRRVLPGDLPILERLRDAHARLNAIHFGELLSAVPIRISTRMRTRLGEVSLDPVTGGAEEIGMSRRHLQRDPWPEVEHTLLHEMIHQWQAETGRAVDHGAEFRRKAREVGVRGGSRR